MLAAAFLSLLGATTLNSHARFATPLPQISVGETAMAWHSGQNGTTDSFLSGPWWISQLAGLAPTHDYQCRQTLLGGYYELIDKWTVTPNPDYWSGLICKFL